ncbi:MAG TPA: low-specificity L-threonine aldolase [Polyangiaceae bacterium]|jgi:threonine aldolase|nr:low-specificity L-threonine aldolase [Polyangiaceae bacterium]
MKLYDLRSDTLTKPSPAMRAAMADADVGDDVYGEDPTVRKLEARVAEILGKESAVFVPSGTMANQIALLVHTRPGDEVIVGEGTHCMHFEGGAAAAWSGVQFAVVGRGGLFSSEEMQSAIRPRAEHLPQSSLVVLENTHNLGGGRVFPQDECERIAERARARGLALHLDGARIWNAAIASGLEPKIIARPFDTLSVCFSKGLGAPVGSAFVGSSERVQKARRFRKMLGGAMRQSGIVAAAALYALEHNRARLAQDHEAARAFAERLSESPNIEVAPVETNIVLLKTEAAVASEIAERAAERGVLIHAMGPRILRAVTHLDISRDEAAVAAEILSEVLAAS